MTRKIEISHRTIIFAALFVVLLWFLFLIREIILQVFVAALMMTILSPLVVRLARWRVPKGLSLLVIYLLIFGVFGLALGLIINPLVTQTSAFATSLPVYLESLNLPIVRDELAKEITGQLGTLPGQIIKFGVSIFSNVITVLTVFILAFYFVLAREKLGGQLTNFFGEKKGQDLENMISELEGRLGGWVRGQLLLMLIVGVATYLGLTLLGIPFALPLALLAGILEIVPNLGPILAAIPSVIVGFGISPVIGLGAAAMSFLINQLENYVLVPKIMEKSVGLNPLVTLLSIIIGFKIAGVAGAILSVPVVISLQIIFKGFVIKREI